MNLIWKIKPLQTPSILKNCGRCGGPRHFVCSNRFRINAQQKKLDVWLIYKCETCDATWNMEILSRVNPAEVERTRYEQFLHNDTGLAFSCAYDAVLLARNHVHVCYKDISYLVEGNVLPFAGTRKEPLSLQIRNPYHLQVRLDRLLCEQWGVSRNTVQALFRQGMIGIEGTESGTELRQRGSCKIKSDLILHFRCAGVPSGHLADMPK